MWDMYIRKTEKAYNNSVRKSEWKRQLGRTKPGWEDNIRKGLKEIRCEGVDSNQVALNKIQWCTSVNIMMNLKVPYKQ
jgi:hypothetical protein